MTTPRDHMKGLKPVIIWAAYRRTVLAEVERQGLAYNADAEDLTLLHYRNKVSPEASGEIVANGLKHGNMAALKEAFPPLRAMEASPQLLEAVKAALVDSTMIKR